VEATSIDQAKDALVDLVEEDRRLKSLATEAALEDQSDSAASLHLEAEVDLVEAAMVVTAKCLTRHVQTVVSHARFHSDQMVKSQYSVTTVLRQSVIQKVENHVALSVVTTDEKTVVVLNDHRLLVK
jgi:hypothetical protein